MKKQQEKSARTKAEFTQAFWSLYTTTPINRITVANVCEKAGYHRGTFYLHFHDVYQVLEEIEGTLLGDIARCVENCMERLAADSSKLARVAALKDVVLFYERNKRFIVVLLGPQGDPSFACRLKETLKPLWKRYVVADSACSACRTNETGEMNKAGGIPDATSFSAMARSTTAREAEDATQNIPKAHSNQEIDLILEFTLAGSLAMISSWLQNPQGVSAYALGHLIYGTAIQNITATTARKKKLLPHK